MSKRRGRVLVPVLVVIVVLIGAVTFVLREPSPVGHFRSAEGYDRFAAAYDRAMAELPEPERTLELRTSYGVVRLYRWSGAETGVPPVVLLPGTSASTPMWADNLPSLLRVSDVYSVDMIGEPGRSVQERPIVSGEDQARWLDEALGQLPEEKLLLFGSSLGGWNVMNHVVHRTGKVAGAVVLDPATTFNDLPLSVILRSIPVALPFAPKSWRDDFNSWTANGAPVEDVPVADLIEVGMQSYAKQLPSPTRFPAEQLAAIDVPILVIMAGRSVMHDSAAAAAFAEQTLRRGTVKVYPEASHAINGEYPDEIAADVAEFANSLA
ncbi:alpha/beta fold hydrolase [Microlunatus speluncae]|uniref:alpha/beta fold hydrolase n=1 Tax=Microlunatus speluncae TaxID=2594267 RepID=UPI0012661CFC|nr:alpha/beta hydrolase [Microlunatus speluncae]